MKHKLLNPLRLLLVAICMLGLAAEGQEIEEIEFELDGLVYTLNPKTKTATLLQQYNLYDNPIEEVTIPPYITYEGEQYTMTELGIGAFCWCNFLKKVNLPETLKKIGEGAFEATGIESIVIPNSVDTIMQAAFRNCEQLKSCQLPNNITVIPGGLFMGCKNLECIEIPNSVERFTCDLQELNIDPAILEEDMKFAYDANLFYATGMAFVGCENLKTVILSNQLTNAPLATFQDCINLEKCELPPTLTYLSIWAFLNCKLKEIEIPANTSTWGDLCLTPSNGATYVKSYSENPSPIVRFTDFGAPINCPLYVPKGLLGVYSNVGGQWGTFARIVEATPVELTSDWRTFCAVEDLDFSAVEGLEAYVATEYQDGKVLMEPIEQVPAGTGVVLKGAPGFYEIPYPDQDEALEPVDNLLVGLNYGERIQAETEDGQCNLFFNDATEMASLFYGPFMDSERAPRLNAEGEQPMFAPADGARLPYHRAYLQLPASEAGKTVEMVFGTLTGIEEVEAQPQTDNAIYNLQGQRVVNPGPGIYIQNGRKFIVR